MFPRWFYLMIFMKNSVYLNDGGKRDIWSIIDKGEATGM